MNIQTEHLANHTARLTVEVEAERVEKAMQAAARRISSKANIPGFRKGKAPYGIVVRYVGKEALLQEAIDDLGDGVYQEALLQSGVQAYAPGQLDNIETEPALKLVFSIPETPVVDLGNYRELRVPFTAPEVTDQMLNRAIHGILENRAVIEPATRPAAIGDKVKMNVHGTLIHDHDQHDHEVENASALPEIAADAESTNAPDSAPLDTVPNAETPDTAATEPTSAAESLEPATDVAIAVDAHEAEHDDATDSHSELLADEDVDIFLRTDDPDTMPDFMPGFSEHIVGMSAGDEKTFSIVYPADYSDSDLAGHTANFTVKVSEVQSATLPILNDDFAKQVTDNKIETLLDYRIKVRKDLTETAMRTANNEYAEVALDKLVSQATFRYPAVAIDEFTDDILNELDQSFRERGLSLVDVMKIEGRDRDSLRAMYQDTAVRRLIRSLALGKLIEAERISVSNADLDAEIDRMSQQFGEQAETFKRMMMQGTSRNNAMVEMLKERAIKQLIAIARGENPPLAAPEPLVALAESHADTSIPADAAPVEATTTATDVTSGEVVSAE